MLEEGRIHTRVCAYSNFALSRRACLKGITIMTKGRKSVEIVMVMVSIDRATLTWKEVTIHSNDYGVTHSDLHS